MCIYVCLCACVCAGEYGAVRRVCHRRCPHQGACACRGERFWGWMKGRCMPEEGVGEAGVCLLRPCNRSGICNAVYCKMCRVVPGFPSIAEPECGLSNSRHSPPDISPPVSYSYTITLSITTAFSSPKASTDCSPPSSTCPFTPRLPPPLNPNP